MFIDTNTVASPNAVRDETLVWVEEQLKVASSQGIKVLSITHQNVLDVIHFESRQWKYSKCKGAG